MISTLLSQLQHGPDGDPTPRLAYGADYNPEQWPREVWEEDVRLMREACQHRLRGDLLLGPYPAY